MAKALLLEGKPVAEKVMEELKASIDALLPRMGRPPGLAVVLVGEDPASQVYVRIKGTFRQETRHYGLSITICPRIRARMISSPSSKR